MAKPAKNAGKSWTSGNVGQLRSLARGNTPTRVIALRLGRTPAAVSSKSHDIKVPLKPVNQSPYGTRKR